MAKELELAAARVTAGVEKVMAVGQRLVGHLEAARRRGLTPADLDRAFVERGDRPFSEQIDEICQEMDTYFWKLAQTVQRFGPGVDQRRVLKLRERLGNRWRGIWKRLRPGGK
jgi:hypothetical protein